VLFRSDWHEKTLGQLFCDGRSQQIIDLLTNEMAKSPVEVRLETTATNVSKNSDGFSLSLNDIATTCDALVIATGARSIPKMGATGFGYNIAEQFGIGVIEPRPGLVPLTFEKTLLEKTAPLSGISVPARISCGKISFEEDVLFTHRGLSGPAILQISSFWREGREISVSLAPDTDLLEGLKTARSNSGKRAVSSVLKDYLPARLADFFTGVDGVTGNIGDQSNQSLDKLAESVTNWRINPAGSEGYRTAEVTIGGINTAELSSKSMQSNKVPGLYFIGEVVDVTGWLGGYNFQWAWSSAYAAGQSLQ